MRVIDVLKMIEVVDYYVTISARVNVFGQEKDCPLYKIMMSQGRMYGDIDKVVLSENVIAIKWATNGDFEIIVKGC